MYPKSKCWAEKFYQYSIRNYSTFFNLQIDTNVLILCHIWKLFSWKFIFTKYFIEMDLCHDNTLYMMCTQNTFKYINIVCTYFPLSMFHCNNALYGCILFLLKCNHRKMFIAKFVIKWFFMTKPVRKWQFHGIQSSNAFRLSICLIKLYIHTS